MPASFFYNRNNSPNRCRLTLLLMFFPLFFYGQSLTGLWTGSLSNDSTTVRKDQLFEIALTEYKGKVYGYSRSEFIVNDTLYYIVKRVKGTINGDICEVTDDDIIAYNFRGKLDKGIKVTSTFRRNNEDGSWYLAGSWKTNATRRYYSVTGKVELGQEKDLAASKLFPHLEELKLAKEIAFYNERNEVAPVVRIAKPEKIKTEYAVNLDPMTTDMAVSPNLPAIERPESGGTSTETAAASIAGDPEEKLPEIKRPDGGLPKTGTKDVAAAPVTTRPAASFQTTAINKPVTETAKEKEPVTSIDGTMQNNPVPEKKPIVNTTATPASTIAAKTDIAKTTPVSRKNVVLKNTSTVADTKTPVKDNSVTAAKPNPAGAGNQPQKPASAPAAQNTNTSVDSGNKPVTVAAPVVTAPRKTMEELTEPVAEILGRKSEFSQVVNFKSDSLLLFLYDNGEIDGDTVSVLMNGELIMARQGLKASAIRKTIQIQPGQNEDFTLVLYAENLGKYPPNTGLLVVHDGEDIYHLRFSSDYQKSTGIVFRRKN